MDKLTQDRGEDDVVALDRDLAIVRALERVAVCEALRGKEVGLHGCYHSFRHLDLNVIIPVFTTNCI